MGKDVEAMFADIAPRYDRTNAVLSLGVDAAWRRRAVRRSGAKQGDQVLDVATGTGDLAFAFAKQVLPGGEVVGADFCAPMLEVAREKAAKKGLPVRFDEADALRLPYDDDRFDIASIAFGIRNVDDPVVGVREMARVVRPGGRVVVLEFGRPRGPISWPYRFYSRFVLPPLGGLLTGNREAYEYLPRTAAAFPCGTEFVAVMREAHPFHSIRMERLTGGIAWLYVGEVDAAPASGASSSMSPYDTFDADVT